MTACAKAADAASAAACRGEPQWNGKLHARLRSSGYRPEAAVHALNGAGERNPSRCLQINFGRHGCAPARAGYRDAHARTGAYTRAGLPCCHNPAKLPFDNVSHRDPARFRLTHWSRSRTARRFHLASPLTKTPTMSNRDNSPIQPNEPAASVSRRGFLKLAGVSGLATAAGGLAAARAAASNPDGTPEQVHLTWGNDPTSEVVISWASLASAVNPRARIVADGEPARTVHGVQRVYTDGLNGETVFAYHACVHGLKPNTRYRYEITADNDSNAAQPFSANFSTAPRGAVPLHELRRSRDAERRMGAVVAAEPLRGADCRAVPAAVPPAERRPLLREPEPCAPARGVARFRQQQPDVGRESSVDAMPGQSRDRVQQRPAGARLVSRALYCRRTARASRAAGTASAWLRCCSSRSMRTMSCLGTPLRSSAARAARAGREHGPPADRAPARRSTCAATATASRRAGSNTRCVMPRMTTTSTGSSCRCQDALSSSKTGNGSDKGIREAWLPLFDRYGVDLVLCGHDHDYERSYPVRGCNHRAGVDATTGEVVETLQPRRSARTTRTARRSTRATARST